MLWLGVHFPDLGLEIFAAGSMDSAMRPRVLVENNRVRLRNAAAVRAGIGQGTTLATVHSIAPEVAHHHRDPDKEQKRLQFLAEALYRFTSQVSVHPPDSVLLEISGSLRLFVSHTHLCQQARALCAELGHHALLQTAKTPLAALLLARSQADALDHVGLAHAEWHLTSAGTTGKAMKGLTERLANMGLHTLGPLLALPPTELAHRFGPELTDFLQRLTGERPDPQEPIRPNETFASSLHLLDPINDKNALRFPMGRLLGELQWWLIGRQLGATRIQWRFHSANKTSTGFSVALARGQQRREAFFALTCLTLEQTDLPEDVLGIELEAAALTPWQIDGPALFGDGQDRMDVAELVDRLRARLGEGACLGIRPAAHHPPEQAWRPVQPHKPRANGPDKCRDSGHPPAKRPLWLFDPPRPAKRQDLELLRGPERIQGMWWQQGISRDYYVARHKNGAECWAYVDAQARWYLQGYFA